MTCSSHDLPNQPIITLLEPPVTSTEPPQSQNQPILNPNNRYQKILQRQMSDNDLSPFVLTRGQLQEIVIHAVPNSNGGSRGGTTWRDELSDPSIRDPSK